MTKKGSSAASSPSAAGAESPAGSGRFVCSMCAKVYRSGAGLRYHKRKRHRGLAEPTALHRVKCQEPACTYQMLAISDLRNHLSNHHQKPEYKCTEEKRFNSIAEFSDWKSSFETQTSSKYVKNCGAKGKSDNQTTEYYYCNRTGPFGQGLRRNKAQGSLRGGIHCTSSMKVEIQNDEQITVQYYPAHYGHSQCGGADDGHLSENSFTLAGMNGTGGSSPVMNGNHHHHHHQQQQQQQQNHHNHSANTSFNHYPSHSGDCSSSSSPGSASTSPSGGSNSNSNHPPVQSIERSSLTTTNPLSKMNHSMSNHQVHHIQHHQQHQQVSSQNSLQNHMQHCIIIPPSFMVDESVPTHSNHHATPVLVVQTQSQQVQHQQHQPQPQVNGQHSQNSTIVSSNTNLSVKKEKCVSDIMRESFQLLSYWPLDHHHGLVTAENEQAIPHSHLNMDEHLMF